MTRIVVPGAAPSCTGILFRPENRTRVCLLYDEEQDDYRLSGGRDTFMLDPSLPREQQHIVATLKRETMEETGMEVLDSPPIDLFTICTHRNDVRRISVSRYTDGRVTDLDDKVEIEAHYCSDYVFLAAVAGQPKGNGREGCPVFHGPEDMPWDKFRKGQNHPRLLHAYFHFLRTGERPGWSTF